MKRLCYSVRVIRLTGSFISRWGQFPYLSLIYQRGKARNYGAAHLKLVITIISRFWQTQHPTKNTRGRGRLIVEVYDQETFMNGRVYEVQHAGYTHEEDQIGLHQKTSERASAEFWRIILWWNKDGGGRGSPLLPDHVTADGCSSMNWSVQAWALLTFSQTHPGGSVITYRGPQTAFMVFC